MAFAGYPSELPLFRSDEGVVFSSGRVGDGLGEATGPISRSTRLDVVVWHDDRPVVFGLTDIEQGYLSGVRGALVRREPDGALERIGRDRFRKLWDAAAAPAPVVLAQTDDDRLVAFTADQAGGWTEDRVAAPENLRLAFLNDGRIATVSEGASGCVLELHGPETTSRMVDAALCDFHVFWVLRDRFRPTAYVYAAAHQSSALYALDDEGLTRVAEGLDAGPSGLQPTHMLTADGVLYFDAGTDAAGAPLVGAFDIASGARTVRPQPRPVSDPVRPTMAGFVPPTRAGAPVEAVFRGGVWNTQPIEF